MATRINKYLSEVGYCSRRVADNLIEEGKVTINGKIPEIGTKVEESDQVVFGLRFHRESFHRSCLEMRDWKQKFPMHIHGPDAFEKACHRGVIHFH